MKKIIFTLGGALLITGITNAQQCNLLDTTFSLNGKVYTAIDSGTNERIMKLKILRNGKILTAGDFSELAGPPKCGTCPLQNKWHAG